jgi:hypothetical protein
MSKTSSILLLSTILVATGVIIFGTELVLAKNKNKKDV